MSTKRFNAEKDVEAHFRQLLEKSTGSHFTTIKGKGWQTDGVIEWSAPNKTSVKVLLEAKFGKDLTKKEVRSSILAQALYYCKKFQCVPLSIIFPASKTIISSAFWMVDNLCAITKEVL